MLGQITNPASGSLPIVGLIVLILIAVAALWVFFKIEHFLIRIAGGFFGLILLAVGVWWFFLRH